MATEHATTDFAAMGYQLLPDDERPPAPDPAEEAAYWERWDGMDAAKAAVAAAFAAWQRAEAEQLACPVWLQRARAVRMPEPCECHGPAVAAAIEAYEAAKVLVDPARSVFKVGE